MWPSTIYFDVSHLGYFTRIYFFARIPCKLSLWEYNKVKLHTVRVAQVEQHPMCNEYVLTMYVTLYLGQRWATVQMQTISDTVFRRPNELRPTRISHHHLRLWATRKPSNTKQKTIIQCYDQAKQENLVVAFSDGSMSWISPSTFTAGLLYPERFSASLRSIWREEITKHSPLCTYHPQRLLQLSYHMALLTPSCSQINSDRSFPIEKTREGRRKKTGFVDWTTIRHQGSTKVDGDCNILWNR